MIFFLVFSAIFFFKPFFKKLRYIVHHFKIDNSFLIKKNADNCSEWRIQQPTCTYNFLHDIIPSVCVYCRYMYKCTGYFVVDILDDLSKSSTVVGNSMSFVSGRQSNKNVTDKHRAPNVTPGPQGTWRA
jgi:hypothetical protein